MTACPQTATLWRLADGTVYACPPETRQQVEARFEQPAEPIEPALADCRACDHLRRPGLADGYCGAHRVDLEPAYGPGHPLRRLPADGGAHCEHYEASR